MFSAELQTPDFGKEAQLLAAFQTASHFLQFFRLALLLLQQTLQLSFIRIAINSLTDAFVFHIGERFRGVPIGSFNPRRSLELRGFRAAV